MHSRFYLNIVLFFLLHRVVSISASLYVPHDECEDSTKDDNSEDPLLLNISFDCIGTSRIIMSWFVVSWFVVCWLVIVHRF